MAISIADSRLSSSLLISAYGVSSMAHSRPHSEDGYALAYLGVQYMMPPARGS